MEIKLHDDYKIYDGRKTVELKPGITFVTGCNGGGKSTFIKEIVRTFKDKGLTYQLLDPRNQFHVHDLNDLDDRFSQVAFLGGAFASEHEYYEDMFGSWISGCRYPDSFRGKEVGIFIDGLDSGGDVMFYKNHCSLFKVMEKDCNERGIILYLVITCNNFYYLSTDCGPAARTLFVPKFEEKKHPLYEREDFNTYVEDILRTVDQRGFKK